MLSKKRCITTSGSAERLSGETITGRGMFERELRKSYINLKHLARVGQWLQRERNRFGTPKRISPSVPSAIVPFL